jgi:subtilisin family serine protease
VGIWQAACRLLISGSDHHWSRLDCVMARIDPYLFHSFEAVAEARGAEFAAGSREIVQPMLLRLTEASAVDGLREVTDCKVTSRVGNIVACTGSLRTVEELQKDPRIISIEGSRPSSGYDCSTSVPFVRADRVHSDPTNPEKGDQALIAVIDGGIDVLHQAFQDKNKKTRIVGIWDQNDPAGPHPTIKGRTVHGTVHSSANIDQYIANGAVQKSLGRDTEGHGTHVTSIAAGQATSKFFGGVAPEAKILMVLPRLRVNPTDPFSLGYSTSHVDALDFIASEAERLKMPVVVNVSLGMNAGAHDGTSNLEAAFDSFTEGGRLPGRAIVKSAGNERGYDGHSKFTVASNSAEALTWRSRKTHQGPDAVELWFHACDELRFQLVDPTNEGTRWVAAGQSEDGQFASGIKYRISYERFHWDNGDSRLLITIKRGQQLSIGVGDWTLKIETQTVRSPGIVHAWLERDNDRSIRFTNHLWEEFTLSIPGTARTVIAVASVAAAIPFKVATYSSYGPTRDDREKPDLAAPGESIEAARAGTLDDVIAMSGTSMATPHVTGAIALLLSSRQKAIQATPAANLKQYNAAQIRAALAQTSQNYNGRSTSSMGYGVLDVRSFLDILA